MENLHMAIVTILVGLDPAPNEMIMAVTLGILLLQLPSDVKAPHSATTSELYRG